MMTRIVFISMVVAQISSTGCVALSSNTQPMEQTALIPGTCTWDAESNKIMRGDNVDFWWEQVTDTERFLAPNNDAKAAVVSGQDYSTVTLGFIRAQTLSEDRICGSDRNGVLEPGTIVIFKTAEGNFGKLRVVGYRALHDLSFSELSALAPDMFISIPENEFDKLLQNAPNIERYHLEIEYRLFK